MEQEHKKEPEQEELQPKKIQAAVQKSSSYWQDSFRMLMRNPIAVVSMATIVLMALIAIFAPFLAPFDPNEVFPGRVLQTPNNVHWLGTDRFGRDLLSRIIFGARISMSIGVIAQLIGTVIGMIIGSIAGYFGKITDMVLSRFMEIMMAFPTILFALFILAITGPGTFNLFIALGLLGWMGTARLVRGQIIQLKEREFVEAARASGAPAVWIIIKHMIPNCMPLIIVSLSIGIPGTIMAEVGLSFLGLGIQPPTPSWGGMVNEARMYIRQVPTYSLFPGLAIMIVVFAFQMLGDCLRDVLDPRLRDSA